MVFFLMRRAPPKSTRTANSFPSPTLVRPQPEWDGLPADEKAELKARQGVANVVSQPLRVVADDGVDVPADGATLGQILVSGNNVMLGYYRDPEATAAAMDHGWFRTGDLAVMHPEGYVEIRDRLKDVIISGGENISSVEVEDRKSTRLNSSH